MKPDAVQRAQYALWAWTVWTCLFGIYQVWNPSGIGQAILDQVMSLFSFPLDSLRHLMLAAYALVALSMAGVIAQIGRGKNWPRMLLLVGFVIEVLAVAGQPMEPLDYLADVPDFGLQGYALWLIYTQPGEAWFRRRPA